jgi:hypothetical protein
MQAVFLTFGLHVHLGRVLQIGLWLAAWFIVTKLPRHWARKAQQHNELAKRTVWTAEFMTAHAYVTKALIALTLLAALALLRTGFTKFLSLQFHHQNHFDRMQVCASGASTTGTATIWCYLCGSRCIMHLV